LHTSKIREVFFGHGHENIQATHKTTLEFTKDKHLSKKGNCIVTVAADRALTDLSSGFKEKLRKPNSKLTILIEAGGSSERICACGSPELVLTHPKEMVIRKNNYFCNRTLAVHADKAAQDLSRELVEELKNPNQRVRITLVVAI
jgi:hypothetical protein